MTARDSSENSSTVFRPLRALLLVGIAIVAGLICDRWRQDRVVFAKPVSVQFTTVPPSP